MPSRRLRLLPLALAAATVVVPVVSGCGSDAPPTGAAIRQRDSLPVMVTHGVSKLISDSGVVRYKVIAEEWRVYDRTQPPRQEFPQGIFLQRLDENFQVDLFITADTAFCYNENLWDLRGNVYIKNFSNSTTFRTPHLYWDMTRHELYSDSYMHIVTPDRNIRGRGFTANEQLTQYHIRQSSGYMPLPGESSPAAAAPAAPADTLIALPPQREREQSHGK
jgi:LPS export ABC transporter protein LptC